MLLGLWPTKLPMTWDSDIGVDHFDVPSLESFYTIPKEESGLGRPPIGFVMGFMTVLAVLHCSHCACLQRSFSICRRIQHVIGTVANEATNDMGFGYRELITSTCLVWNHSIQSQKKKVVSVALFGARGTCGSGPVSCMGHFDV